MNYQQDLDVIIEELSQSGRRPKLLLHSCCAPCSSYVLEYLSPYFEIFLLYYNPNIAPAQEYRKRLEEQKRLVESLPCGGDIHFIEGKYQPEIFREAVKNFEDEPEGGARCDICFALRLKESAKEALRLGCEYFCTTLTVSPHKNALKINRIAQEVAEQYGLKFLPSDFKKRNGYKRSLELSSRYGLYRQNYCGCEFSAKGNPKPRVAIIYDFDGTLSPGNMQEFGFIQAIGKNPEEFWEETNRLSKEENADSVLTYMYAMLKKAHQQNKTLSRESLRSFGKKIELYPGVKDWFARINAYGARIGLSISHYVDSSGLTEMIEGSPIAKEFRQIYACSYLYDENGIAYWPAVVVNYTTKTQYLYKINKGIEEVSDNTRVNEFLPVTERPVPFSHMIYLGDGSTDIPSMRMLIKFGGHAVAVYKPNDENKKAVAERLRAEGRVHFACEANYLEGSDIDSIVKSILNKIKADYNLSRL